MRILIKGGVWKNSEDEILKAAVMKYGLNNWSRVASLLVRKSARQCKARWYEWLDPSVKKTEWTREEEEKLLHLAKLFPTQWRTIAPIVGRTAHQCLEHYEKLLDRAQGRDSADMGERDPRRLRPGEIDPNPETKPSRADPVDLDDDEKEMLAEARARLANTRGKKAKRKAREKQLEEARRLASLQKRRELKAAGIQVGRKYRIKRKYIDYAKEIPFEQKVPAGFYEIGPEETPEGNLNFANISLQQLEGRRRVEEENRLRKDDTRKLKRLQEENLPAAMEMIEKLNDPQTFRKRTKLTLPEPQLADSELEEIVKLGAENAALSSNANEMNGPTNVLLSRYSMPTPAMTPMRTPRRDNTILVEAQNAVARTTAQTPLEGGDNPRLLDSNISNTTTAATPHTQLRTPNPLAANLGNFTPSSFRGMGGTTPSSVAGGMTPFRDDISVNEGDDIRGPRNILAIRSHIKTSLEELPLPQNEIEIAAPDLPPEEEKLNDVLEEDMEDVLAREAEEDRIRHWNEWKRQTQVIQLSLPRPYFLDTVVYKSVSNKGVGQHHEEAVALLTEEMKRIVEKDALSFPIKGMRLPKEMPVVEKLEDDELERARMMLNKEMEIIENYAKHGDISCQNSAVIKAWDEAFQSIVYSPRMGRYANIHSLSKVDRLDTYKRQFEDLKRHLEVFTRRHKKIEAKYVLLSSGYEKRLQSLCKSIEELHNEYFNASTELFAFQNLRKQEYFSAQKRKNDLQFSVEKEKKKNLFMQRQYGTLQSMKRELLQCLAFNKEV